MGTKAFDLAETISDLLRRIDEGRRTVRESQQINDTFQTVVANRERAIQRINDLNVELASSDDHVRRRAKAELKRQIPKHKKLYAQADELWRQLNEANGFLGAFSHDVHLLTERLPLKPEWEAYRQAIKNINVRGRGSWADSPDSPALDTLEMRLGEMRNLAVQHERSGGRKINQFPTPDDALWKDVSLTFVSEHRVRIAVQSATDTRNYSEMGFEDRRGGGGKPDSAWACLMALAKSDGWIERPAGFNRPGWSKVEKNVQAVRARLKALFRIPGNPLPFRKKRGYEAQFKINLSGSVNH